MRKKMLLLISMTAFILSGFSHGAHAAWYVRNPGWEILVSMGGEFYDGPPVIQAIIPGTLGLVMRHGGAFFEKTKTGVDVSFLLMIGNGREGGENYVSNDPDMVLIPGAEENDFTPLPCALDETEGFSVSLYTPSGKLYKSVDSLPGDYMISISVPAKDNKESGQWRYTINKARVYSTSDQPVLMGVIDGIYDMHNGMNGYWLDPSTGTTKTPDGESILFDGTKIMPDGSIITVDGYTIKPDREPLDVNVQIQTLPPGKSPFAPEGGLMFPDGTIIKKDGSVLTPGKALIARDGTVTIVENP